MGASIFDTIKIVFALAFVLALMMVTLRLLGKYQNKLSGNKNIKVLERTTLSQNTTLNIVKVGEKLYLMSSSSKGISILKELDNDEINQKAYETINIVEGGFDSIFKSGKKYIRGFKGEADDKKKGN